MGFHLFKIHKSTALKWQDARSVSCSTDLDYCVVSVDRVGVFLEHIYKSFERFTPNFPVIYPYFACLLTLVVASTTTAATFT